MKIWFQNRRTKWKKYDTINQADSIDDRVIKSEISVKKSNFGSSGEEHSSLDGSECYFSDGSKPGHLRSPDSVQDSPSPVPTTTTPSSDVPIGGGHLGLLNSINLSATSPSMSSSTLPSPS